MSTQTTLPPETPAEAKSGGGVVLQRLVMRQFDGVTLYNADCLDILPELVADAIISDPPYGMDWNTDSTRFSGKTVRGPGRDRERIHGDAEPFDPSPWLNYPSVVLFGSNHYAQRLPVGTTLVWLKRMDDAFGSFLSDAEVAWMKGGHGVYAYRKCFPHAAKTTEAGDSLHPSQKPVSVMSWVMERAKVPGGATMCDPYMGSGSTAIACIRTGRKFIGVEKDRRHFETACERIRCELAQGVLLPHNDQAHRPPPRRRRDDAARCQITPTLRPKPRAGRRFVWSVLFGSPSPDLLKKTVLINIGITQRTSQSVSVDLLVVWKYDPSAIRMLHLNMAPLPMNLHKPKPLQRRMNLSPGEKR